MAKEVNDKTNLAGHIKNGEKKQNTRCTQAVKQFRLNRVSRMIAQGASQMDIRDYCVAEWGLSPRMGCQYYRDAVKDIRDHWDLERTEFAAILLQQLNDLHKKTSTRQNDSVTLGCINSAAKIARLFD